MTIEEAVKLAENGDIGAMITLGQYYMSEDTRDLDEAQKWYVMAAENGVPHAAHMAALVCVIQANGGEIALNHMEDNEFMYDFALETWQDAYKWINKTIEYKMQNAPNTENVDLEEFRDNKRKAAYHCGLYSCCTGREDDAIKYLEGMTDKKSKLILGHVLFQKAEADDEYKKALVQMKQILDDKQFVGESKSKAEETVMAVAAVQVATGYEYGIGVSDVPDIEKAIGLLTFVSGTCKHDYNKEKLAAKIRELQQTKTVNQTSSTNTSSGGCYVATAVYGSYDCPQVWTLRRYRDDVLASTWYGRAFVRIYYAVSPMFVKWFGHTEWFKNMWKEKLDHMVETLQNKGFDNTPYDDRQW